MKPWTGVFPSITTQMHRDGALNLEATARHDEALIQSGVAGLIFLGSLGENQTLTAEEKRRVLHAMVKGVNGRVPMLSGVAETSTAEGCRYVRDGEQSVDWAPNGSGRRDCRSRAPSGNRSCGPFTRASPPARKSPGNRRD